jgi:hypothetical protein
MGTVQLATRIDEKLDARLRAYKEKHGGKFRDIVEEGIRCVLDAREVDQEGASSLSDNELNELVIRVKNKLNEEEAAQ